MPATHIALVLLICAIWGFNFIASITALSHWSPFLFTSVRFSLVLLVLLPWIKMPPAGQGWRLVLVGLCNGAAHFALVFLALRLADDVSSIAILLQTYVPMSAILAWIVLKEPLGWRSSLAIAVAFVGVLVVGLEPDVAAHPLAMGCALVSAFFLAAGTLLMRSLKGVGAIPLQGWVAVISLPPLLALTALFEFDQIPRLLDAPPIIWASAGFSAWISSIIAHSLLFILIQRHPVATVTPWLLLAPILAVVFSVVLLGEQLGPRLVIGGTLVMAGVLAVAIRRKEKLPPPAVEPT